MKGFVNLPFHAYYCRATANHNNRTNEKKAENKREQLEQWGCCPCWWPSDTARACRHLVTCEKCVVQFDSIKHRRFSPGTHVSSCTNTGPISVDLAN